MSDLQTLQLIKTTAEGWGLQLPVSGLLRSSGIEFTTRQTISSGNVRRDSAIQRAAWTGRDIGARRPDVDETPLSVSECWHGLTRGLL